MRIGFLVVDDMVDSGYAVMSDVLDAANVLAPRLQLPEPLFRVCSYGLSNTVTTTHGLTLRPTPGKQMHDDRPDVLVTPSMLGLPGRHFYSASCMPKSGRRVAEMRSALNAGNDGPLLGRRVGRQHAAMRPALNAGNDCGTRTRATSRGSRRNEAGAERRK